MLGNGSLSEVSITFLEKSFEGSFKLTEFVVSLSNRKTRLLINNTTEAEHRGFDTMAIKCLELFKICIQ